MARNYKDLEVWRLSYDLSLSFYKLVEKFPKKESDNLISQIRRAASSIPVNIAEGCSRFSKNGFLQFLSYAYGSCKELEVFLMMSRDLGYIDIEDYKEIAEKLDKTARKLFVFIKKVESEKWFDWFKR